MKTRFNIRAGLAVLAATALISGAAWHGLSASANPLGAGGQQSAVTTQPSTAAGQPGLSRIPGGRGLWRFGRRIHGRRIHHLTATLIQPAIRV